MELIVFNNGIELSNTSEIESSNWAIKRNDIGTFEYHLPLDTPVLKSIIDNPLCEVMQDRKYKGIVVGYTIEDDLAVFGRTLEWHLSNVGVRAFSSRGTFAEIVTKIKNSIIQSNSFTIDTSLIPDTATYNFTVSGVQTLLSVLQLAAKLNDSTFIMADADTVVFIPKRTNEIIIDKENNTVNGFSVTSDYVDYYNSAYIKDAPREYVGTSEPPNMAERPYKYWKSITADMWYYCEPSNPTTIISVDSEEKVPLVDIVINNNSGLQDSRYINNGVPYSELTKLLNKFSNTLDSEIVNMEYNKDYLLGDYLKVNLEISTQNTAYRKTAIKRVTGVSLNWEAGEYKEEMEVSDK